MIKKKIVTCFLLFLALFCVNAQHNVELSTFQKEYIFDVTYYEMPLSSTFEQATKKIETKPEISKSHIGNSYWTSFYLSANKQAHFIELTFPVSDKTVLYIPQYNNRYKTDTIGLSVNAQKNSNVSKGFSKLLLSTDSLDLSAPFYVKKVPSSIFGLGSVYVNKISVILYNEKPIQFNQSYIKNELEQDNFNFKYFSLIGMIVFSFFIIFIHYLITKHIYFLWYSLYLFFLIFNYGYRTFYFYNIYSEWNSHLYMYLNQNGQMLANLAYLFFIRDFVNIKKNYPKLNLIYKITIYFFIAFAVVYNTIIFINPYFPYHLFIFNIFVYVTSFLCLCYLFYMLIIKPLDYTSLVFAGSLLLLFGYVGAKVFTNFFILVPLIMVETLLFLGVLTYLDLKYFKKSLERDRLKEINELKNKFYANISHEFRTPLTLISGPVQKRLLNLNTNETDKKDFNLIKENTDRLLNLVNQMLDLSMLDTGFMKLSVAQGNLADYLRQLILNFTYKAKEKNISITTHIENISNAWFDKNIIEKVVFNLLSNAIKYSPKNTEITITAHENNQQMHFTISNWSKSIEMDKIFNRFYQSDKTSEGVGIGLSLVKELVELNHGTVSHRMVNKETIEFLITIPIDKKTYNENEIATDSLKEITTQPIDVNLKDADELPVVLIVDDNKELLSFMNSILENNYTVLQAINGQDGIKKALQNIPDLIVSDIMMPIADGIELCNTLKENELTSHIPIVLLTAKSGTDSKIEGLRTGADAYVTKPFNVQTFLIRVQKLIEVRKQIKKHYIQSLEIDTKLLNNTTEAKFIDKVKSILKEHISESDFKSETLAEKMRINRMQLHRKLKAITNMGTGEFIRLQRLQYASVLLKENKWTIAEIAFKSGFSSPSYFSKIFKEMYHCSPKDYVN